MSRQLLDTLGLCLIHFLWQGTVIAVVMWCILEAVPRRRADIRYACSCLALAVCAVAPLVTWMAVAPPLQVDSLAGAVTGSAATASVAGSSVAATADAVPLDILSGLALAWVVGVAVLAVRILGGGSAAHRLARKDSYEGPEEEQALLAMLASRLGLRRTVQLRISDAIDVPGTLGMLKSVVIVPSSFVSRLPLEVVEALLLHELAHIKRHDYLVNLAQSLVETVLFYHPGVWWISKTIRQERENCCDDIAVSAIGSHTQYARALTVLEEFRGPVPALAPSAKGENLMQRITRILEAKSASSRGNYLPASVVLVAALAILAGSVYAQANPGQHKKKVRHAQAAAKTLPSKATKTVTFQATVPRATAIAVSPQGRVRVLAQSAAVRAVRTPSASSSAFAGPGLVPLGRVSAPAIPAAARQPLGIRQTTLPRPAALTPAPGMTPVAETLQPLAEVPRTTTPGLSAEIPAAIPEVTPPIAQVQASPQDASATSFPALPSPGTASLEGHILTLSDVTLNYAVATLGKVLKTPVAVVPGKYERVNAIVDITEPRQAYGLLAKAAGATFRMEEEAVIFEPALSTPGKPDATELRDDIRLEDADVFAVAGVMSKHYKVGIDVENGTYRHVTCDLKSASLAEVLDAVCRSAHAKWVHDGGKYRITSLK